MARYLFFGNLTIDDTVMPDGRTAMASVGGNVIYAAIGARVWSDDLAMISRLGRGYPDQLLQELKEDGYAIDGLVPCQHNRIRQWQLYDVEGGRTYVRLASSPGYDIMSPLPEEIPPTMASDAEACMICAMPLTAQERLVDWAFVRGLRIVLDPHHEWVDGKEAYWRKVLPKVGAFLPSREEAERLLGGWPGPEAAVRILAEWGAPVVCLKLGADGAVVYEAASGALWSVPTATVMPIDTTGCGDAFGGGFLVGWQDTGSLEVAVQRGAVSASIVAKDFGAQHAFRPDRLEAVRRLSALTIRSDQHASN